MPKEKETVTDANQSKAQVATSQSGNPVNTGPKQTKDITTDVQDKTSVSVTSNLTSSAVETSEDEAAQKREQEIAAKKKGRLTEEELKNDVDIVLTETKTRFFFHLPTLCVAKETDEHEKVSEEIRSYDALLENKKGSDSYMGRGTQTLNLA